MPPVQDILVTPREQRPSVITFDCYGTLVQWYELLTREVAAILAAQGARNVSPAAIVDAFSGYSRHLTAERPHRMYKDILRIGFRAAFHDHGVMPHPGSIERLACSPRVMRPHPDVPGALRLLRKRYRLAIFTNSDNDLITPTVEGIGVPFDFVITAEQAQSYKPSREIFEYGYDRMGVKPEDTVHVAMGM